MLEKSFHITVSLWVHMRKNYKNRRIRHYSLLTQFRAFVGIQIYAFERNYFIRSHNFSNKKEISIKVSLEVDQSKVDQL